MKTTHLILAQLNISHYAYGYELYNIKILFFKTI